jgi:hypothetical protein
MMRKEDMNLG